MSRHQSTAIRIASYNIHACVGTDGRYAPDRIASVIGQIEPDILGLQEVRWSDDRATGMPFHEMLASNFPDFGNVILGPNMLDHRGHYGNVLLTRMPVNSIRRLDLTVPGSEPRGAIIATIDLRGQPHDVLVTHLGLRVRERRKQVARLLAALDIDKATPWILLGDFNEWRRRNSSLRSLLEHCQNGHSPRTYPARLPLFPLDRIIFRNVPCAPVPKIWSSHLAEIASDHRPVVAQYSDLVTAGQT